jgi:GNAT superfamily N-acetyltransferase
MATRVQATGGIGGTWKQHEGSASFGAGSNQTAAYVHKTLKQFDHEARNGGRKKEPSPIAVRPISIDDASYVIDSWVRSYRRSPATGPIEDDVFKIEQRARIDRLICRSKTFIACEPEDKRQIRGWVCFEPGNANKIPVIHYVCVQPSFQVSGIGTALVSIARQTASDVESFMWCTHDTAPMRHIRPKWNLLYNPYLLEVKE